jgi:hypothetical protein
LPDETAAPGPAADDICGPFACVKSVNIVCAESGDVLVEAAAAGSATHKLTNKEDHAKSISAWIGRDMNYPRSCLPRHMLIIAAEFRGVSICVDAIRLAAASASQIRC